MGLGTFTVEDKPAHAARNPRTGETINVPAKKAPKFKISASYKDKYNKYEDLNITDFEDQIELLFTVNDQLVDGDNCVDIIANAETIRYMLSIAMSELDYAPHKINMEKDDATYCLEMFDDGSLRVFLYDKYNDSLQGTSIYLYQEEVAQDIVDFVLNFYSDSDIWLFGYEDEDDIPISKEDVSDMDIVARIMEDKHFEVLPTMLPFEYLLKDLWRF